MQTKLAFFICRFYDPAYPGKLRLVLGDQAGRTPDLLATNFLCKAECWLTVTHVKLQSESQVLAHRWLLPMKAINFYTP